MSTKYDDILNATRDLVYEHGLHAVSMSQIARHANVGMGTIYNHFSNKVDLINALFTELSRTISAATLDQYDPAAAIETRLAILCRNLLRFSAAHPTEVLLFEQLNHASIIKAEVQDHDFGMKSAFFELVTEAGERFKPLPPVLMGNALVSFAASFARSVERNAVVINAETIALATTAWLDLMRT